MCGIAGVVDANGGATDASALARMLRHRGPDSLGWFERSSGAIAQSRLSIIDLVTGDPPITNEDGSVAAVANGEIYNYRDLQAELLAAGHTLKTACDTEVLCHLHEELSPVDLARRLDGMFAFAIWDERRERLVLGRDRFGKKPLYWWHRNGRFVFGSEIKAVLADPHVSRGIAPGAIESYLAFGYVPEPATFHEGISTVPAGHVLTLDLGGEPRIERYWIPPIPGVDGVSPIDLPFERAAAEVGRLLDDAVDRRLMSDVPLGAFLSGGIDSSAVVASMCIRSDRPVRTFTVGFDNDDGFDERPFAAEVARRYGTDHTEFVVHPDKAELIERLVWHHDQPFGDSSALPTFLLSELTSQHVTVALAGDGSDELFGGYERFAAALQMARLHVLPEGVRRVIGAAAGKVPASLARGRIGSVRRMLRNAPLDVVDAYREWIAYVPESWRAQLLATRSDGALDGYRRTWDESAGADLLARLLDLNLKTYLLGDLLPKVDRMSMAHGLEVRSPFLDVALADFALRLPRAHKVKGLSLKRVLKHSQRDRLPASILDRSKRGFGIPLDRWFRTDLRAFTESLLCAPSARVRAHLDPTAVRGLFDQHLSGRENNGNALWTLLTLEVFLRSVDE